MTPQTTAYYNMHRKQLLEMKEEAIKSIACQTTIKRMFHNCPCGAVVGCKQLDYHFISIKHRRVCGDLPNLECQDARPI